MNFLRSCFATPARAIVSIVVIACLIAAAPVIAMYVATQLALAASHIVSILAGPALLLGIMAFAFRRLLFGGGGGGGRRH